MANIAFSLFVSDDISITRMWPARRSLHLEPVSQWLTKPFRYLCLMVPAYKYRVIHGDRYTQPKAKLRISTANESLHLSTSDGSSIPAPEISRSECKTKGQPDVARNKESYRVESSREQPFALTRSPLSPQIVSAQKSQLSILLPHPPTCPLQP
jgi:hypothetical protein